MQGMTLTQYPRKVRHSLSIYARYDTPSVSMQGRTLTEGSGVEEDQQSDGEVNWKGILWQRWKQLTEFFVQPQHNNDAGDMPTNEI